jgi:hypothetical protein
MRVETADRFREATKVVVTDRVHAPAYMPWFYSFLFPLENMPDLDNI